MIRALLCFAALALTVPALAEPPPVLRPVRDAVVTYRSGGTSARLVTLHFTDKGNQVRIDAADGSYVVFDVANNRKLIVMADRHLYDVQESDVGQVPLYFAPSATYTKIGSATVAGLGCTRYSATLSGRSGELCLTADGLVLRARIGDTGAMEATSVSYAAQDPALFLPPEHDEPLVPKKKRPNFNF